MIMNHYSWLYSDPALCIGISLKMGLVCLLVNFVVNSRVYQETVGIQHTNKYLYISSMMYCNLALT